MSQYLSMETLSWMLFDVFKVGELLSAPRFQDHDVASFRILLDSVKKFADAELYPVFRAMDADPARMIDGRVVVHPAVATMLAKATELGLVGSTLDYDDGGMQLPATLYQSLNFIVDAANNHLTGYTGLTSGALGLLCTFGSEELKATYRDKMMSNEWGGTMALTEPQAGSSLSDVATEAIPRDDGSYSISGQKIWISGGDHQFAENFVHFTLVRVPGGGPGTKGISLMLIPKFRPENGQLVSNDVATVGDFQKMGQRGYTTTHLVFGENGDCRGWLLGTLHKGLDHMFQMMNGARIHVGRGGAAIATAAYYASRQFALERAQAIDVLLELGLSERVGLVEDFVADRPARGQAVGRQHHARFQHPRAGDKDGTAVAAQFVGDIGHVDAGEQQRFLFPAHAQHEREQQGGRHGRDPQRREQPRGACFQQ